MHMYIYIYMYVYIYIYMYILYILETVRHCRARRMSGRPAFSLPLPSSCCAFRLIGLPEREGDGGGVEVWDRDKVGERERNREKEVVR